MQMNATYRKALSGELVSTLNDTSFTVTIKNGLPIPVELSWISTSGAHELVGTLGPGGEREVLDCYGGYYFLFAATFTGSFVGVITIGSGTTQYTFNRQDLLNPGEIGHIPQPTKNALIPPDSPRVCVSCAEVPSGNVAIREQYWERQSDSYCLAAGEKKTVSMTTVSGKQQTSSDQETFAAAVGVSASGGWGPISASVSASLSKNSTTFQQVTVTEQSTAFISDTLENKEPHSVMYLRWQLNDIITVFSPPESARDTRPPITSAWVPKASIITGESPVIVEGPYNPLHLSAPFEPPIQPDRAIEIPRFRDRTLP